MFFSFQKILPKCLLGVCVSNLTIFLGLEEKALQHGKIL